MAAIGRALMSNPRVLLCDEISLGLAPIVIRDIYAALPKIKANGASVILVEQDIVQALQVADRVYCFQEGPHVADRAARRARPRKNPHRVFRRMSGWINTLLQGVMLGGLYALFAAGLSLIFGVMRLVNLAHGDLIVLAAFVVLALTRSPGRRSVSRHAAGHAGTVCLRLRAAARAAQPHAWGGTSCRRCWSHSACRSSSRTACWRFSPPTASALNAGAIETASIQLGGGIAVGTHPTRHADFRRRRDPGAECACSIAPSSVGPSAPRPTIPRSPQLMGIDNRRIFSLAMAVAMVVIAVSALYLGMRANFDPTIGPARLLYAFEAVIIGGLGELLGHAGRRRHHRRRPDGGRPRSIPSGRSWPGTWLSSWCWCCGPAGSFPARPSESGHGPPAAIFGGGASAGRCVARAGTTGGRSRTRSCSRPCSRARSTGRGEMGNAHASPHGAIHARRWAWRTGGMGANGSLA